MCQPSSEWESRDAALRTWRCWKRGQQMCMPVISNDFCDMYTTHTHTHTHTHTVPPGPKWTGTGWARKRTRVWYPLPQVWREGRGTKRRQLHRILWHDWWLCTNKVVRPSTQVKHNIQLMHNEITFRLLIILNRIWCYPQDISSIGCWLLSRICILFYTDL